MTHRYIGTKEVVAWPAADQDKGAGYGVKYEDGHISWSPKEAFEKAYRTSEPGMPQALGFGDALHYLERGAHVARAGWNGKGMWLKFIKGRDVQLHTREFCPQNEHDHGWQERVPTMLPWIGMKTADNGFVPWLASQTDVLAKDWVVLA